MTKKLGALFMLCSLTLVSCSSTKIPKTESASVERIGIVVLGADSIQSVRRDQNVLKSFRLETPVYTKAIQGAVKNEFERLGYQAIVLNAEPWNKFTYTKKGSFKNWNSEEMTTSIVKLCQNFQLSHIFLVGPDVKTVGKGWETHGFSITPLTTLKGISAGAYFRGELINSKGKVVAKTSFREYKNLQGQGTSKQLKTDSLFYFQGSMQKMGVLVTKTGLPARNGVALKRYDRTPSSAEVLNKRAPAKSKAKAPTKVKKTYTSI